MKTCTACGRELPTGAFYLLNTGQPRPSCKPCFYVRTRAYQLADTRRLAAHEAVRRAVRSGRLIRPAQCLCGKSGRLNAHHDDYDQPLDVIWLCGVCHTARHADKRSYAKAA